MRRIIETKAFRAGLFAAALTCGAALGGGAWAAAPALTNAAFFDADASGTNISGPGQITRGAWSTVLDQQNVSGNFGAEFFLATTPTPGPNDFITPVSNLSAALSQGANTFYFFADSDDTAGGTAGFGLNLYLNDAGQGSPSISAFVPSGTGQTATADGAPCTAGFAFTCTTGANSLVFTSGLTTITLTSFQVTARGGGAGTSTVDRVNSDNTQAFTPPPHANGITDTYGMFTLDVETAAPTSTVPEPAAWALMILGFGGVGASLRSRRRVAA